MPALVPESGRERAEENENQGHIPVNWSLLSPIKIADFNFVYAIVIWGNKLFIADAHINGQNTTTKPIVRICITYYIHIIIIIMFNMHIPNCNVLPYQDSTVSGVKIPGKG